MYIKIIVFFLLINGAFLTFALFQFDHINNIGGVDPECNLPVEERTGNPDCRITFIGSFTNATGSGIAGENGTGLVANFNSTVSPVDTSQAYFFNVTSQQYEFELENATLLALIRNPQNQNLSAPADIFNDQADISIFSLNTLLDFFDGAVVFNVFESFEVMIFGPDALTDPNVGLPRGFFVMFAIIFGILVVLGAVYILFGRSISGLSQ